MQGCITLNKAQYITNCSWVFTKLTRWYRIIYFGINTTWTYLLQLHFLLINVQIWAASDLTVQPSQLSFKKAKITKWCSCNNTSARRPFVATGAELQHSPAHIICWEMRDETCKWAASLPSASSSDLHPTHASYLNRKRFIRGFFLFPREK